MAQQRQPTVCGGWSECFRSTVGRLACLHPHGPPTECHVVLGGRWPGCHLRSRDGDKDSSRAMGARDAFSMRCDGAAPACVFTPTPAPTPASASTPPPPAVQAKQKAEEERQKELNALFAVAIKQPKVPPGETRAEQSWTAAAGLMLQPGSAEPSCGGPHRAPGRSRGRGFLL